MRLIFAALLLGMVGQAQAMFLLGGQGQQLPPIPAGWPTIFTVGVNIGDTPNATTARIRQVNTPYQGYTLAYRYLSGGINSGWQTFGTNFVANTLADYRSANLYPAFTYYMIVGSPPFPNDGQQPQDIQVISTMAAYYADFTALMKQLKSLGPVTVHIEPDLWGYILEANGNQSSPAAVSSTGNPDLAGLANNVGGLMRAYKALRDKYAPNVLLAANVSTFLWNSNTDCSTNVTAIADTDAAFMQPTSPPVWDLFFTDIAFGDSAAPRGVWWDATNVTCPNFNMLKTWATEFTSKTNRRLVLWQTPAGNTVMDTDNNTAWHWQDNRAQYYLRNYGAGNTQLQVLANAGVMGLLFMGGEPNPTTVFDGAGDGITNPPPINGNTGVSTVSDDDGGILAVWVSAYGKSPLPLPTSRVTTP